MSRIDKLVCTRIAEVTHRKALPTRAKSRISTLIRTAGFTFHWKGLANKAAAIN